MWEEVGIHEQFYYWKNIFNWFSITEELSFGVAASLSSWK